MLCQLKNIRLVYNALSGLNYAFFADIIMFDKGMLIMNKTFRKAWKKFWEPVLGFPLLQWIIAGFVAAIIWIIYFTCTKKIINYETFKRFRKSPAIFVFWHGRSVMLSPIVCIGGMHSYAVASQHKDGRIMAKVQRLFGLRSIYGSTSKGGISVLRQGIKVLRAGGYSICISPDGPGGPSLRVQDGALYFSKMSGAPIIPVCYTASRGWFQARWDRFFIPKPFSKILCEVGTPIYVDAHADAAAMEDTRKKLEDFMVAQMRAMDAKFNLFQPEQDMTAGEFKQRMRDAAAARKSKGRA